MFKYLFTIYLILLLFSVGVSASEGTTEHFHKRFQFIKHNNKLIQVRDKSLEVKFSITPYIKYIKDQLLAEQKLIRSKGAYEEEIRSLLDEHSRKLDKGSGQTDLLIESLLELENLDIEYIFNHSEFKKVIHFYESRISDALAKIGLNVVATLNDPTFFYKRNTTYEVVKMGLNFARKRLSTIPLLNTASYVLVQVEKLIRERRLFHQNMLLHYLESFTAEELNMTHDEANFVYSSIYESRIPWYAFWESSAAKSNWPKYGVTKFFQYLRAGKSRLRMSRDYFDNIGDDINYAFKYATEKGNKVVLNLFDGRDSFRNLPSIAFYPDNPQKIMRLRLVLQLGELGLSFVPIPQFIKDFAESYMKSLYVRQKLTEGGLYAYYESHENETMKNNIMLQNVNPFNTKSLK